MAGEGNHVVVIPQEAQGRIGRGESLHIRSPHLWWRQGWHSYGWPFRYPRLWAATTSEKANPDPVAAENADMKIAEMEWHHDEYTALESKIAEMLANRWFPSVFSVCEESFPHIAPAIQFRKKRSLEPETPQLSSFRVVFRYAPPLFEHGVIQSLSDVVTSTRLLARHENNYLDQVAEALDHEEVARMLWNHLERQPGSLQRDIRKELGVSRDSAVTVLEVWEELGLVARDQEKGSYRLYLRSRLDAPTEGVCHNCGVRGQGRKDLFFKPIVCGKCGTEGYYHIVRSD